MLGWLAARRRKKRADDRATSEAWVRQNLAEPVAFVAAEWGGMVNYMMHVAPEVWTERSLGNRISVFEGGSSALKEITTRFSFVRDIISNVALKTGDSEEQVAEKFLAAIFVEALVSTGEDREEVNAALSW